MKVELRGVGKAYETVRALDHVSLQIEPGQIVSLLGLNARPEQESPDGAAWDARLHGRRGRLPPRA